MIKFVQKIKLFFRFISKIENIDDEISNSLKLIITKNELLKHILEEEFKEFEEKIKNIAHAYTANLNDTKTDYLKKYIDTRLDCIQGSFKVLEQALKETSGNVKKLESIIAVCDD